LAQICATPDIGVSDRTAAAGRRARDCSASAKSVISKGSLFARLPRIGDADQAVLGVPAVIALPVREQVAVGVKSERLARQVGELIEIVVASRLRACARIDGRGIARFRDGGDEILGRRRVAVVRILARRQPDIADRGQPPVARIGQITPTGCQIGTDWKKLALRSPIRTARRMFTLTTAPYHAPTSTLGVASQQIGPLMREGELEELELIAGDPARLREIGNLALRLLEPFRTFANEDEKRTLANSSHRAISSMLTEQRRMDPAIERIVSQAFYNGKLKTQKKRAHAAETESPPFTSLTPMPSSPVVAINFEHVSKSGKAPPLERGRPRWNNPSEIEAVLDVLRHVRAVKSKRPTLAVLSPYKAQVDMLDHRIGALLNTELKHLAEFCSARRLVSRKRSRPRHHFIGAQ
jgi:AAA domain